MAKSIVTDAVNELLAGWSADRLRKYPSLHRETWTPIGRREFVALAHREGFDPELAGSTWDREAKPRLAAKRRDLRREIVK